MIYTIFPSAAHVNTKIYRFARQGSAGSAYLRRHHAAAPVPTPSKDAYGHISSIIVDDRICDTRRADHVHETEIDRPCGRGCGLFRVP